MSSEKTTNLQLNKWVPTDYVKMDEFNENFDIIDGNIGILQKPQSSKLTNNFGLLKDSIAKGGE